MGNLPAYSTKTFLRWRLREYVPLEHPSATRQRTRLPRGMNARLARGGSTLPSAMEDEVGKAAMQEGTERNPY